MARVIMFSQNFPNKMGDLAGAPTYFPCKFINAQNPEGKKVINDWYLDKYGMRWREAFRERGFIYKGGVVKMKFSNGFKPHTIRTDTNKIYKSGAELSPRIWAGRPYRSKQFQFAPNVFISSIQKLTVRLGKTKKMVIVEVDGDLLGMYHIEYKEEILFKNKEYSITDLAKNDGFPDVHSFFGWFGHKYEGRIIHFTKFKY